MIDWPYAENQPSIFNINVTQKSKFSKKLLQYQNIYTVLLKTELWASGY